MLDFLLPILLRNNAGAAGLRRAIRAGDHGAAHMLAPWIGDPVGGGIEVDAVGGGQVAGGARRVLSADERGQAGVEKGP